MVSGFKALCLLFCSTFQVHVFQAFPFLDAGRRAFTSCRDFVRAVLPRLQTRSPRALSEERLEHEIDNENVRMVRGDGIETASGRLGVNEEMKVDEETETIEEDDDQPRYSSWGRSRSNSILSPLSMTSSKAEISSKVPHQGAGPDPSSLRRIQSALSLLSSASPPMAPARNHRRTPSVQTTRPSYTRRFTGHMPMPPTMSKYTTPPPSPSIRRKNASHPDITSLVEQWTSSGPANQTTMYKPHMYNDAS